LTMKKALHILLMLVLFASAASVSTAQIQQSGKVTKPTKTETPKCKTCGKTIDKCQYKGKHPAKCKTCGKTVDKCKYGGKHPAKCKTCGKTVDKCQYSGNHPAKKSTGLSQAEKERIFEELRNNMVWVEGGTFMFGVKPGWSSFAPKDTVSGFYICKYEVTRELWLAVMDYLPESYVKDMRMPIDGVSWESCQKFIDKLNQITGVNYRFPKEDEWEFAARGGVKSQNYMFAGSDDLSEVAWCSKNSSSCIHTVGAKKPNELGLYDMSGNVWEWCQDEYPSPFENDTDTYRMFRGGCSWEYELCNVVSRSHRSSTSAYGGIGFRLAASSL